MQPTPQGDRSHNEGRSQSSRSRKRKTKKSIKSINPAKLLGPLPLSEAGQRLTNLFPNGWDWIYADAPGRGSEIDWETIKKFPLSPVELWTLHQDPAHIIGIRPNATTRWGIIDIDRTSKYHPSNDPDSLAKILEALEDIGIVRTLINQSSHSKGLHIYIPLPEAMSSFGIAVALKYTLEGAGIRLRSGQCETFPNPKRYLPEGQGYSLYIGIRLPMQPHTGFIPLDQDLNPLLWTLDNWLDAFDQAAAHQDLHKLEKAIAECKQNHRIRGDRNPKSLESWSQRIEEEKLGWSGPGETNEKLKLFACEARVFMGMDSISQIADHIYQTAQNTPGFAEHSNHTRDLSQRSKDVASWAMRYYWPMGTNPSRETGYHSKPSAPADFIYHQSKREAAQHRIKQAVEVLTAQNRLPSSATARAKAIVERAHISQQTLYRPANKVLWHPDHFPADPQNQPPQLQTVKQLETLPEQEITQPQTKQSKIIPIKKPEPLINKRITQLYKYVGFVINQLVMEALDALALKGQRASLEAIGDRNSSKDGGLGGETTSSPIQNWSDLRKSLPLGLQEHIAKAERSRQRKAELEQRRREQAKAKQQQLKLDFAARPRSVEELAVIEKEVSEIFENGKIDRGVTLPQEEVIEAQPISYHGFRGIEQPFRVAESSTFSDQEAEGIGDLEQNDVVDWGGLPQERSPFEWEQNDFNSWYELAKQFGLVSDYQWRNAEYWVFANCQWLTFGEMLGAFSTEWLRGFGG